MPTMDQMSRREKLEKKENAKLKTEFEKLLLKKFDETLQKTEDNLHNHHEKSSLKKEKKPDKIDKELKEDLQVCFNRRPLKEKRELIEAMTKETNPLNLGHISRYLQGMPDPTKIGKTRYFTLEEIIRQQNSQGIV